MDLRQNMLGLDRNHLSGQVSGGLVVSAIVLIILVVISLFWFQAIYEWLRQNGNFTPAWLFGIAIVATIIFLLVVYFLARCAVPY